MHAERLTEAVSVLVSFEWSTAMETERGPYRNEAISIADRLNRLTYLVEMYDPLKLVKEK